MCLFQSMFFLEKAKRQWEQVDLEEIQDAQIDIDQLPKLEVDIHRYEITTYPSKAQALRMSSRIYIVIERWIYPH